MPKTPNVKSFSAQDTSGRKNRFTVSQDIIDYIHSARPFGLEDFGDTADHGRYQGRVIAIPDRSGPTVAPMMLTIGTANRLRLVRRDGAAMGGGWRAIELNPGLPKGAGEDPQIRAIGAGWSNDGRITVAVAYENRTDPGSSHLAIAHNLTSAPDAWEDITWTDYGTRPNTVIHGLRVLEDEEGVWTTVIDHVAGPMDSLLLIRSNGTKRLDRAQVFSTAVGYQEIHDFEPMVNPFIGSGIAVLGRSGSQTVLSFRPFPTFDDMGKPTSVPPAIPLPCPDGAKILSVGQNRDDGHDLYIGGAGVHVISANELDNHDAAALVPVMDAETAPNIRRLTVAESPDGAVSVWALRTNGDILTARAESADRGLDAFSSPLRARTGIVELAPVHGDASATTSMVAIHGDGRAFHLHRDAETGAWMEAPVLVSDKESAAKVSCYGTVLRVMDRGRSPRAGVNVTVTASALTSVILNGNTVFIGPTIPAKVQTDHNGAVNLFDRVRSLSPPTYRIQVEGMEKALDINPAAGAQERLSTMSAEDLRTATIDDGRGSERYLLPDSVRSDAQAGSLNGMAMALNQASSLALNTTGGILPGVRWSDGGPFSTRLASATSTQDGHWAITGTQTGMAIAGADTVSRLQAAAASPGGTAMTGMGDSLGDFLEGLWSRIQEGWTFVIGCAKGIWEFIVEIGGKVKRFVLDTLEEIGGFFTWLWDQVKTGLEQVWDFLKFLFEWDDILAARDIMVSATDQALVYIRDNVRTVKPLISTGFGGLRSTLESWKADAGIPITHLEPPKPGQSFADALDQLGNDAQSLIDQATGNSVVGWVTDQIQGILDNILKVETPDFAPNLVQVITDFLLGTVVDQVDNMAATWSQLQADLHAILGDDIPATDLLNVDTLTKLVVAVGADTVIGLLGAFEALILRAIDLMADMIEAMRGILQTKISFPFIEKLVELVAPGTSLDTSFTLIDAFMLLPAIPATITYKLIFGKAPFKKGDVLVLPFGKAQAQGAGDIDAVDLLDVLDVFSSFKGLFAPILKTIISLVFAVFAIKGDYTSSKVGAVLGTLAAIGGAAVSVLMRREDEGETVSALEWASTACATVSAVVTTGTFLFRYHNTITDTKTPGGHIINNTTDLIATLGQLVLGAVIMGLVVDAINQSDDPEEGQRLGPEMYSGIANIMDQAGSITSNIAVLLPQPAGVAKFILVVATFGLKGGNLAFKIAETIEIKKQEEARA